VSAGSPHATALSDFTPIKMGRIKKLNLDLRESLNIPLAIMMLLITYWSPSPSGYRHCSDEAD
jgi:hypothetical protein